MSTFARRHLFVSCLVLIVLLLGCDQEPADLGAALPADTLAWIQLENLSSLEAVLEQHGLWEILVAELAKPETRQELQDELGLTVSDDPAEDLRLVLESLLRADISVHEAEGEEIDDEVLVFFCLEARDAAAATTLLEFVSRHATGTETWGEVTVHMVESEDESFQVLQEGSRVLAANHPDLLRNLHTRLLDPPADGLTTSPLYGKLRDDREHDIRAYVAPELATAVAGAPLMAGPQAPAQAALKPLFEKYGGEASFVGMDYAVTQVIARQALLEDNPLAPLMENPATRSELASRLPEGTFGCEVFAVHEGGRKLTLLKQFYDDLLEASRESGEELPPMAAAPFEALESVLGFSIIDAADLVAEMAFAGADDPQFLVLFRGATEADAEQLLQMVGNIPALGMLAELEPLDAAGSAMRVFSWANDPEGRLNALGRRGDTVVLALSGASRAAIESAVAGMDTDPSLVTAAPDIARPHLEVAGHGWFFLDVANLVAVWDLPLAEMLEEVPPELARRLSNLVAAGHVVTLDGGVSETVMELSGP